MPGQYKYQTFVDDLKRKQCYASFKGSKRFSGPGVAGLVDKVLHTIYIEGGQHLPKDLLSIIS